VRVDGGDRDMSHITTLLIVDEIKTNRPDSRPPKESHRAEIGEDAARRTQLDAAAKVTSRCLIRSSMWSLARVKLPRSALVYLYVVDTPTRSP